MPGIIDALAESGTAFSILTKKGRSCGATSRSSCARRSKSKSA